MQPGPRRYLAAAFNARPLGMFVAPNWILLAAFALLGFLNWGFWVLGFGLELAYLFLLSNSARFRRYVDSQHAAAQLAPARARVDDALARLDRDSRARYERLADRCQRLVRDPQADATVAAVHQGALDRLLWMFVQLLRTRQALAALLREAESRSESQPALLRRADGIARERARADDALAKSLAAQEELLRQRAAKQGEAQSKLAQVESELERIEHQVELMREEAVVTADPSAVSLRIDAVSAGLSETMSWVKAQPDLEVEDLLDEAPELLEARRINEQR